MVAKRSAKSSAAAAPQGSKKAAEPAVVEQQQDASDQSGSDRDGQSDEQSDNDNDDSADESGTDDEQPQSDNGDGDDDDEGLDLDDAAQDGNGDGDEEEEELEAVGFGDAMSKILGQNVAEDAQPILAKRTTARMREILAEKKIIKTARTSAAEKREKEQKDMILPSHATAVADRRLRAIATKGVVALFNAIEKHQHQNGRPTDDKNDKKVKEMSKDNFLGLLKAQQKSVADAAPAATKSSWSVVQDDYMMGAKLKDWDATHGTEKGRARNDDDAETEAAEDAAWRQVGDLDSDDESAAAKTSAAAGKRKGGAKASDRRPASKKSKRS